MIEPGEYCAIVTIEFQMVGGVQSKGYRMFVFTQTESQPRVEVADWAITEAVRMMREDTTKDGVPDYRYGDHYIPLLVSIEPN